METTIDVREVIKIRNEKIPDNCISIEELKKRYGDKIIEEIQTIINLDSNSNDKIKALDERNNNAMKKAEDPKTRGHDIGNLINVLQTKIDLM